jgi:hypothetical protein
MAQYIHDRFGKFPGTVPSIFTLMYVQAHHLDLDFYDHHFKTGAYLETHARHMARWHPSGPAAAQKKRRGAGGRKRKSAKGQGRR